MVKNINTAVEKESIKMVPLTKKLAVVVKKLGLEIVIQNNQEVYKLFNQYSIVFNEKEKHIVIVENDSIAAIVPNAFRVGDTEGYEGFITELKNTFQTLAKIEEDGKKIDGAGKFKTNIKVCASYVGDKFIQISGKFHSPSPDDKHICKEILLPYVASNQKWKIKKVSAQDWEFGSEDSIVGLLLENVARPKPEEDFDSFVSIWSKCCSDIGNMERAAQNMAYLRLKENTIKFQGGDIIKLGIIGNIDPKLLKQVLEGIDKVKAYKKAELEKLQMSDKPTQDIDIF